MLEFPRWKYALILLVVVLSVMYALPNVYPQDPSVQITANRGASVDAALETRVQASLKQAGVAVKSIDLGEGSLLVRLPDLDAQTRANDTLRTELGDAYTVALNLASTVPDWITGYGGRPIVRGLDLQGGVHFVLQVDQKAALDKRIDAYTEDMRATLRDKRVRYQSVERRAGNTIAVTLADAADAEKARVALAGMANNATAGAAATFAFQTEGARIIVSLPPSELEQISGDAIEQNITTLRNRVNEIGVAEPVIQRQGDDRVVVQLPGVQDTAAAKRLIGATATLEFRAVVDGNAYDAVASGSVPPAARVYYQRDVGPDGKPIPVLLSKRVLASGDEMVMARTGVDQNGLPAVDVTLNNAAGQRMLDFTSANVDKLMSVVYIERIPQVAVVDGKEVRTVKVSEEALSPTRIAGVFGKNFQTTGLEKNEAENLARLLRAGSLAAPMDFIEERVVGPSLGKENVARGVAAVTFAFLFTLLFFLVYYRMFGVITSIALLLNLVIVAAVLSLFGATMTLPGFAGLALSIGLSVDANVLINERIREELRAGMPPKNAIVEGYDKASGTILDTNITGIVAGVALYAFGTGPLQGFAITMV
ncbi:MAG TPA: protein translocase subunit SecD, partial [Pseudoxanthomonas sp.]|nr:protein translocase subunit SecD [Pseudoxanthomonas sp.]